jgi:hypothetical protein
MRYESAGLLNDAHSPLLPAEMAQLLGPFQVVRAFSSSVGFREYFAVRSGKGTGRQTM